MLNKVQLIGNLGADPEARYTTSGTAVANLSVATTEKWKDKESGEKREDTSWHRVTAFGKLAEIMIEYLSKGSRVYVEGRLKYGSYEKDGVTRYTTDIIASQMTMLGGGKEGGNRSSSAPSEPQQEQAPLDDLSDIPF